MEYKVTPGLDTVLKWFMFTVTILGVSVLTSKFQAYGNIFFNIVLGIIVLIAMKPVFFETLKLSTLLVGRFIVLFACFGLLPGPIFVIIVLGLYIINILEATMTDFFKNKQYFNGVSGCLSQSEHLHSSSAQPGAQQPLHIPRFTSSTVFQSSAPRSRSHPNISQIKQPYSIAQSQVQPRSESQSQLQ